MENFVVNNPTILHFGDQLINDLGKAASECGKTALLMYGKGSIKDNGIYNDVMDQLNSVGIKVVEYSGIKSNPITTDVDQAAALAKSEHVDMIVAVGGGSVIDSAKMTAITAKVSHPVWTFYTDRDKAPTSALPILAVLTLAATGTEMNPYAVLQNDETKEKYGFGNPLLYPKHSFLNPNYTMSVNKDYTAYGITDLIAHCLEQYFGEGHAPLADRYVESIIKTAVEYGPKLMSDLQNYEYREMIMWAATNALNGTTGHGRKMGDWGVHGIEHSLSVLYDIAHGAGLSIVYPAWMKHHKTRVADRISMLGKAVFNVEGVDETIKAFETFFKKIGSPIRAQESNIKETEKPAIIDNLIQNKVTGSTHRLKEADYKSIVDLIFA